MRTPDRFAQWETVMRVRYRALPFVLALVGMFLGTLRAHATAIDASNYLVGTNLTHAIPGITLEQAVGQAGTTSYTTSSLVVESNDISEFGYPPAQSPFLNTLGSYTVNLSQAVYLGGGVNQEPWTGLYAGFARPVKSVTVTSINASGDNVFLFAFGANGDYIGFSNSFSLSCLWLVPVGSSAPQCYNIVQTLSFNSTTPIRYILTGGGTSATYITEIETTPEPSSIGLFAGGLLAIAMLIFCRRRRSRMSSVE